MSMQLTKEEKKIYSEVIHEWLEKDINVSHLRIVWVLRTERGLKRHTMSEMARLVRPRLKQQKKRG